VNQGEEEKVTHEQEEEGPTHHSEVIKKAMIASISGVPMFNTFRMKGFM
jgi:hypothetical protein